MEKVLFALVLAIIGMGIVFGTHYIEGELWMVILAAQAIPYVSAIIGALVAHYSKDRPTEAPSNAAQSSSAPTRMPEAVEARTATT